MRLIDIGDSVSEKKLNCDYLVETFFETSRQLMEEIGSFSNARVKSPGAKPYKHFYRKGTLKTIRAHRMVKADLNVGPEKAKELADAASNKRRRDVSRVISRPLLYDSDDLLNGRIKDLWQNLNVIIGKKRSDADQPIQNPDDNALVYESCQKGEIWAHHFEKLAHDTTGNSRYFDKWRIILPEFNDATQLEGCDDRCNGVRLPQSSPVLGMIKHLAKTKYRENGTKLPLVVVSLSQNSVLPRPYGK
ncbi:hypothetical protein HERIO_764 [Hepatospora eriocheir]|uniref:Uncharacterized protein n=1 Tax=Hepatospora eriocheir TaxID=1081669 RepID=A0A1X0QC91_9MICR|nr:hypothetical protein HERIO_764 [Hepatospora eriocheir]